MTTEPMIDVLADLVARTKNKTTLTVNVHSGGYVDMQIVREVKGNTQPREITMKHSAPLDVASLDGMAREHMIELAAKALGLEGRYEA